jgi:hypothetical protein
MHEEFSPLTSADLEKNKTEVRQGTWNEPSSQISGQEIEHQESSKLCPFSTNRAQIPRKSDEALL